MMKSIPIIILLIGVVFAGITVQNLIKVAATVDEEEKAEWKKFSMVFLGLAIISISLGIILIKVI